jgi:hypothetical protein
MARRISKTETVAMVEKAEPGRAQYATALIEPGKRIEVNLVVDGVTVATLGPWTASAQADRNALAQVRLRVADNVDRDTLVPTATAEGGV